MAACLLLVIGGGCRRARAVGPADAVATVVGCASGADRPRSAGRADDERDDPLLALGAGDLLADLAPAPHDDGPVGHLGHVVQGVRDDDDGLALVAQAEDEVEAPGATRAARARRSARRG